MNTPYKVACKYCGHIQTVTLSDLNNSDIECLNDAIEYDQEYECASCHCSVRLSEALFNNPVLSVI